MRAALDTNGYVLTAGVLSPSACDELDRALASALETRELHTTLDASGALVGTRHLARHAPDLVRRASELIAPFASLLSDEPLAVVRALLFDKTPGRSWAVPWHQDRVIAVAHADPGTARPGGVPTVDAPRSLLERMLAIRIHLDEVGADDGALLVRPGSHLRVSSDLPLDLEPAVIEAHRGDVLAMRPLLFHASPRSRSSRRRRVLHLELSPDPVLPSPLAWHDWIELPRAAAVAP